MKIKKILSLVLASVMVLALAVPAFATETVIEDISKGANVKVTGELAAPTIKVSVPTSAKLIANPFKLTVKKSDDNGLAADSTDEIISPTQYISSSSNVDLWVSGTVTGTPSTDVKLVTAEAADGRTWTDASKTKDMFLYMKMKTSADNSTELDASAYADGDLVVAAAKAVAVPAAMAKASKLEKVDTTAATPDVKYVAFRLGGKIATNLSVGTWNSKDKVDVAIAFTFLPVEPVVS